MLENPFDIYEVFAQTDPLAAHEHQFSLLASSPEMALTLAQENFLRRRTIYSIWVVPRTAITKSTLADRPRFQRLSKTYRSTEDYKYLVAKWRKYRQSPMSTDNLL